MLTANYRELGGCGACQKQGRWWTEFAGDWTLSSKS